MSINRNDLLKKMSEVSMEILNEKDYISFIDVLMRIGKLSIENYESWRYRKVPYLEKVINVNLVKIKLMLRSFHENSLKLGLHPSKTVYVSWGKGTKSTLIFSKSRTKNIEDMYSTHFIKMKDYA
jgi:hypothetical protein